MSGMNSIKCDHLLLKNKNVRNNFVFVDGITSNFLVNNVDSNDSTVKNFDDFCLDFMVYKFDSFSKTIKILMIKLM